MNQNNKASYSYHYSSQIPENQNVDLEQFNNLNFQRFVPNFNPYQQNANNMIYTYTASQPVTVPANQPTTFSIDPNQNKIFHENLQNSIKNSAMNPSPGLPSAQTLPPLPQGLQETLHNVPQQMLPPQIQQQLQQNQPPIHVIPQANPNINPNYKTDFNFDTKSKIFIKLDGYDIPTLKIDINTEGNLIISAEHSITYNSYSMCTSTSTNSSTQQTISNDYLAYSLVNYPGQKKPENGYGQRLIKSVLTETVNLPGYLKERQLLNKVSTSFQGGYLVIEYPLEVKENARSHQPSFSQGPAMGPRNFQPGTVDQPFVIQPNVAQQQEKEPLPTPTATAQTSPLLVQETVSQTIQEKPTELIVATSNIEFEATPTAGHKIEYSRPKNTSHNSIYDGPRMTSDKPNFNVNLNVKKPENPTINRETIKPRNINGIQATPLYSDKVPRHGKLSNDTFNFIADSNEGTTSGNFEINRPAIIATNFEEQLSELDIDHERNRTVNKIFNTPPVPEVKVNPSANLIKSTPINQPQNLKVNSDHFDVNLPFNLPNGMNKHQSDSDFVDREYLRDHTGSSFSSFKTDTATVTSLTSNDESRPIKLKVNMI